MSWKNMYFKILVLENRKGILTLSNPPVPYLPSPNSLAYPPVFVKKFRFIFLQTYHVACFGYWYVNT